MKIRVEDLKPESWAILEQLFGAKGACGGCWCMSWRIAKGEKWTEVKGAQAKRRQKALVTTGRSLGVIAFADGEPVGWCAYGPRRDFSRLDRAPSLACDDADRVWSLPCFFVRPDYRGKGVGSAMLKAALQQMKKRGAEWAEGYPAKQYDKTKPIPGAFAWTGTLRMFESAGFELVGDPGRSKLRMRKRLRK